jgi:hypothetical protein
VVFREQPPSLSLVHVAIEVKLQERVLLPLDVGEPVHESRPARETVLARDDELRVGKARARGRRTDVGVLRARARERLRITGTQSAKQCLGLLVLVLEARPRRQWTQCGHDSSFRDGPCPRGGPEKRVTFWCDYVALSRMGHSLPADRRRSDSATKASRRKGATSRRSVIDGVRETLGSHTI